MTIREILAGTDHRPWIMPGDEWQYYQEWNNAVFLHWEVDYGELRKFVPADLEIDLFGGKPWVSVVAFSMERIRMRNLPAFPPVSDFHEINIRTYVRQNGKSGVYFLSIEGGKKLSCQIAKGISQLPYRFSKMNRAAGRYLSDNLLFGDSFRLKFEVGKDIQCKSDLDRWLTERYALFQDTAAGIKKYEIHHAEWPLMDVVVEHLTISYPRFRNLITNHPHKFHYSKGIQVIAWKSMSYKDVAKP